MPPKGQPRFAALFSWNRAVVSVVTWPVDRKSDGTKGGGRGSMPVGLFAAVTASLSRMASGSPNNCGQPLCQHGCFRQVSDVTLLLRNRFRADLTDLR